MLCFPYELLQGLVLSQRAFFIASIKKGFIKKNSLFTDNKIIDGSCPIIVQFAALLKANHKKIDIPTYSSTVKRNFLLKVARYTFTYMNKSYVWYLHPRQRKNPAIECQLIQATKYTSQSSCRRAKLFVENC